MAKPEEELHLPYNPASEDSYMRILHWQGALQLIIASKACVYYNVFITMNHAHCHTFMRLYLYMYMYLNLDSISCSVLHNYM